jgi:hypothetical protein
MCSKRLLKRLGRVEQVYQSKSVPLASSEGIADFDDAADIQYSTANFVQTSYLVTLDIAEETQELISLCECIAQAHDYLFVVFRSETSAGQEAFELVSHLPDLLLLPSCQLVSLVHPDNSDHLFLEAGSGLNHLDGFGISLAIDITTNDIEGQPYSSISSTVTTEGSIRPVIVSSAEANSSACRFLDLVGSTPPAAGCSCNDGLCANGDQCNDSGTSDPLTGLCGAPTPKPEDTPCDDGDANTVQDACSVAGLCAGVNLCENVACSALDQCHIAGSCDPQTGLCSNPNAPNGTDCDDADPYTEYDQCNDGSCAGILPAQLHR